MLVSMKGQDLDIRTGGAVSSYGDISPIWPENDWEKLLI